ncbi:hypothetical protein VB779_09345 [Haloarculaceae archaeon H-GB11]|nr:hypothetical protein [Haloarculaceae archaeon H-GB11]
MPPIETDLGAARAAECEREIGGSPNLLTLAREDSDVQSWLVDTIIGSVVTGLGVYVSLTASAPLLDRLIALIILAGVGVWTALSSADSLLCVLSEDHECRDCREEGSRWEAET